MKTKRVTQALWSMILIVMVLMLGACSSTENETAADERTKVGIVLTEVGLGDRSFNDAAFEGLVQARNENTIQFDYKEPGKDLTAETAFEQFAQDGVDLIIGLSDTLLPDLEKVAQKYPEQPFLIVDGHSELPNVTSMSFRSEEGSYLAGMIAGFATTENHVGFLGGMEIPLLRDFQQGFEQGVQAVNPDATVQVVYAGDFGNSKLGEELAAKMIQEQDVDVIYVAAGLTGVGSLTEIQKLGKYAIGVDTDQFFLAEKAVLTSMLKNVNVSIYNAVNTFTKNNHSFPEQNMVEGLAEDAVGLTALHNITLSAEQQQTFEDRKAEIISGKTKIMLEP
ncbi:basic membrane protein A [Paenibacillus sp. PvP094]|uniref:BMP family lipoprotein n=1 Tax=Paenibacillus sp. PvP094 TaxID=3156394 RepID=UPI003391F8F3